MSSRLLSDLGSNKMFSLIFFFLFIIVLFRTDRGTVTIRFASIKVGPAGQKEEGGEVGPKGHICARSILNFFFLPLTLSRSQIRIKLSDGGGGLPQLGILSEMVRFSSCSLSLSLSRLRYIYIYKASSSSASMIRTAENATARGN